MAFPSLCTRSSVLLDQPPPRIRVQRDPPVLQKSQVISDPQFARTKLTVNEEDVQLPPVVSGELGERDDGNLPISERPSASMCEDITEVGEANVNHFDGQAVQGQELERRAGAPRQFAKPMDTMRSSDDPRLSRSSYSNRDVEPPRMYQRSQVWATSAKSSSRNPVAFRDDPIDSRSFQGSSRGGNFPGDYGRGPQFAYGGRHARPRSPPNTMGTRFDAEAAGHMYPPHFPQPDMRTSRGSFMNSTSQSLNPDVRHHPAPRGEGFKRGPNPVEFPPAKRFRSPPQQPQINQMYANAGVPVVRPQRKRSNPRQ